MIALLWFYLAGLALHAVVLVFVVRGMTRRSDHEDTTGTIAGAALCAILWPKTLTSVILDWRGVDPRSGR